MNEYKKNEEKKEKLQNIEKFLIELIIKNQNLIEEEA